VWDTGDVASLVEAVCDPRRRTLVFVAGSDPRLPFDRWLGHVRDLLRDCVGLAGGYVLSPEATVQFNNAIGPAHQVDPWAVRTFHPGVEPDDLDDGRRHKVLGMDRIVADPVHRLAGMLGRRARRAALENPLPTAATKVDRVFAQIVNEDLLGAFDLDQSTTAAPEQPSTDTTTAAAVPVDPVLDALVRVLGCEITVDRVLELGQLADLARHAQASRAAISARLAEYETELAELNADRHELRTRLDDAQLDAAVAEEERTTAAAEVRRLQKLLTIGGRAEQIWVGADIPDPRPQDCDELADMLDTWTRVRFTGDLDQLRELDQYESTGGWASKIWDVLGALEDYARAVAEGSFAGNVHHYLANTPAGCRSFSAGRHSPESPILRANPQLATLRTFPVPDTVCPDREIFMGAHFKIAQFGMISPRLHYHNDARGTGQIYVGYIGKHLKNSRTN
jgi:hypothetical protein